MNKVILLGRLTEDAELKQTPTGMSVTRFTVACNRYHKNGDTTADFVRCTAFGTTAENISRYFSKGLPIALTGSIKTGSYDGKDGKKVYTTDIVVESFEFVPRVKSDQAQSSGNYQPQQTQARTNNNGSGQAVTPDDFEELLGESDLPF